MPVEFGDERFDYEMIRAIKRWSLWDEHYLALDNVIVEPNRCLIIGPDGRLLKQSRRARLQPSFPDALKYITHIKKRVIPEAIIYDGTQSINYYHHIVDGLISLSYFQELSDLCRDIPLVVNRWIYESRFFNDLRLRSEAFASFNWLIQETDEWLELDRAYLLFPAPFQRKHWLSAKGLYPDLHREDKSRRIFLSRDRSKYTRGLSNEKEAFNVLQKYGFELVYAEHLTIEAQQELFAETEILVALEGMGMIQQIFMNPDSGRILEIVPSNRMQTEYYWQAWTLKMRYFDVLVGSSMDDAGMYQVDLSRLDSKVISMLEYSGSKRKYGQASVV